MLPLEMVYHFESPMIIMPVIVTLSPGTHFPTLYLSAIKGYVLAI